MSDENEQPPSKAELLANEQAGFDQMQATFIKLTAAQATAPAMDNGWSIKDNTAHLTAWLAYITMILTENGKSLIPDGEDEHAYNLRIYNENKDRSLNDVIGDLLAARQRFRAAVEALPDAAFSEPRYFAWNRSDYQAVWLAVGNSYGHYEEQLGYLRSYLDSLRPKVSSKAELLAADEREFAPYAKLIEDLSEAQLTAPAREDGQSIKDTLGHLAAWQKDMSARVEGAGHSFSRDSDLDEDVINAQFCDQYKDRHLVEVWADLQASRDYLRALVEALPEEAVTDPGYYPWREGRPLIESLDANMGEHYLIHYGYLRPYLDSIKDQHEEDTPPTRA